MREMTFDEINEVSGGMTSREAGYEAGKFVAKTIIGVGAVAAVYALVASA